MSIIRVGPSYPPSEISSSVHKEMSIFSLNCWEEYNSLYYANKREGGCLLGCILFSFYWTRPPLCCQQQTSPEPNGSEGGALGLPGVQGSLLKRTLVGITTGCTPEFPRCSCTRTSISRQTSHLTKYLENNDLKQTTHLYWMISPLMDWVQESQTTPWICSLCPALLTVMLW